MDEDTQKYPKSVIFLLGNELFERFDFYGFRTIISQQKQRDTFFHMFYFSINFGSVMSEVLIPVLRTTPCFEQTSCYALAFAVPGVAMVPAFLLFVMGTPFYKMKNPTQNMLADVSACVGTAVKLKCKSREKKDHWLDHAIPEHGETTVNEVKILLRVLYLYLPIPLFWALLEQIATGWTFQARRLDGDIGGYFTILPDQVAVGNPLLVMLLIPVFNYLVYPLFAKINVLNTPLQRITTGGMVASVAYVMTALLSVAIENELPPQPFEGNGQIRIFNILPCDIKITYGDIKEPVTIRRLSFYAKIDLNITGSVKFKYNMESDCSSSSGEFVVYEQTSAAYFFTQSNQPAVYAEDDVRKLMSGYPNVRTMVNLNGKASESLIIKYVSRRHNLQVEVNSSDHSLYALVPGHYDVHFGSSFTFRHKFAMGGVYTVAAVAEAADEFAVVPLEVTSPNSIHVAYILPQYVFITVAEIMFSITGIEFSYSQAPQSMKTVLQACWLLTFACGQLFVVVITSLQFLERPSSAFFLYAILMFFDMVLFIFMSVKYEYVTPA